ncbi:MAG: M3 family oligoendopeptidase [Clostridia bacterium]|nr:M3 family oligoendopeptidase [Clostridia bacterium]
MPYERPDIGEVKDALAAIEQKLLNAKSAAEQLEAFRETEALGKRVNTLGTLVYIRNTINTKDEFYAAEREFIDEVTPLLAEAEQKVSLAMLASPFRAELEKELGELYFKNLEITVRTFKPEMIELMQQENKLTAEYQKLYASAAVEWEGRTIPLPLLGPYKQSTDREVRRLAFEKEGKFFDANRQQLDRIYGDLVKVRNKMARMLGHENYIQLGYDRLGRNCYGYEDLKEFRRQIAEDVVPVVNKLREAQRERIGVDKLCMYDTLIFKEGNPVPHGSADDILAAGKEMYHGLSAETAEFIDFMYENELLDVLSKDGKAPGGYCADIPAYGAPFIFSNFNGTAGDVDVLTHEAGHAFAAFRSFKNNYISAYQSPTIEACEVHSMSMEFLTGEYHHLFFGEDTAKYEYMHIADALSFLPYGCMVDEFQHIMYENEDMTPEERNATWEKLENKYRPLICREGMPFYGRGAGWQRQLHIYESPLYYIDYCMAQTVAFQFWLEMLEDKDAAWKKYLAFVDMGGTETFEGLVKRSGLALPYEPKCMEQIATKISEILVEKGKKLSNCY